MKPFMLRVAIHHCAASVDSPDMTADEVLFERLKQAGCDDATAVRYGLDLFLLFDREAEDIPTAVKAIEAALDSAQLPVRWAHLEPEALTVKLIEQLAEPEGDSVTIVCPNPNFDGGPNRRIIVNGYWTGHRDVYFDGDTLNDALYAALTQRESLNESNRRRDDRGV